MKKQLLAGAIGLFLLHGYQSAQAADVVSFTLIDASNSQAVGVISPGAVIDRTLYPTINIRADVNGAVGSVKFALSGQVTRNHTESTAPYALYEDTAGIYDPWAAPVGSYTLTGRSYTGSGGTGTAGVIYSLNFSVIQSSGSNGDGTVGVSATPRLWHKVTLTQSGPFAAEADEPAANGKPNPFRDYRMQVTFTNPSATKTYSVPGYFATDGAGAESTVTSGNVWRAHFCPNETGLWSYTVSFTSGTNVAVNGGGTTLSPYNNKQGTFTVAANDKTGDDFRAKGRLMLPVNGERYQRFAGTGDVFIKVGPDSPETLLGYGDFDGTSTMDTTKGPIKTWSDHVADWVTGEPTWKASKGKGLIGALNYLASKKMNSISFLTYNAGGDGKNVWPFISYTDQLHYDVSKLAQWEVVFEHAQKKGIHLHFKTQEQENDNDATYGLDGGSVGIERKLYYRELIARFGHHLALTWNLGEENTQSAQQRKDMSQYFYDNDPYRHLIVIHSFPSSTEQSEVYTGLLGANSKLDGASIQTAWNNVHSHVLKWINDSTAASKPWVVSNDEQGPAGHGVPFDLYTIPSGLPTQAQVRGMSLWGSLLAGGSGMESYFGYDLIDSGGRKLTDLLVEDYRPWSNWWNFCRYAAEFIRTLPVTEMSNADSLVGGGSNGKYCLAQAGEIYCVYLPSVSTATSLNLAGQSGSFSVQWFDPRNGGALQNGTVTSITGGASVSLGQPPSSVSSDWVVLVRSQNEQWIYGDIGSVGAVGGMTYDPGTGTFTVQGAGADIYGTSDAFHFVRRTAKLSGDGSITARVVSVQNTYPWAKAGVMMRESTATNSRNILIALTPGNGVTVQHRLTNGGSTTHAEAAFSAPREIRLVRAGTTVTASYKNSSGTWTPLTISGSTFTVAAGSDLEVGLAVTSHVSGTLCQAVFDSVDVSSTPTDIIMDNTDSTGVTITGDWVPSTWTSGYVGTNYIHDGNVPATKGLMKVKFAPNLTAGTYSVYARWTASSVDRATNAPFYVQHSGGLAGPFLQDQTQNGNTWMSLGTYTFAAGTGGYVEIGNAGTNENVIVDAVRFVKQ
jgi:hypothetical protein